MVYQLLSYGVLPTLALAGEWSYGSDQGLSSWQNINSCGGDSQSPVDINRVSLSFKWDPLNVFDVISSLRHTPISVKLADTVNAHSLQFLLQSPKLSAQLSCPQFHFHLKQGEHTLKGRTYFGEYHLVCFHHEKHESLEAAVASNEPGALAVLGFWIDISDEQGHENDISEIVEVKRNGNTENAFDINFPLPEETLGIFRYEGSLTTPPCSEVVTWSMFTSPLRISSYQADMLRDFEPNLVDNYRQVQPLNNRVISHYSNRWRVDAIQEVVDYAEEFGVLPLIVAGILSIFVMRYFLKGISRTTKEVKAD